MKNQLYIIISVFLLVFFSPFILTRQALFQGFDFSKTGEIGDTIGGITSPLINLIGAILVYISFKAQINANKIQTNLLNQEIENQKFDRNFSVVVDLFNSLKTDYNSLAFDTDESIKDATNLKGTKGISAIIYYGNYMKKVENKMQLIQLMRYPIYSEWRFIIFELNLIMNHIDESQLRLSEREKLKEILNQYYLTRLNFTTLEIEKKLKEFDGDKDILKKIEELNNSYNTQTPHTK